MQGTRNKLFQDSVIAIMAVDGGTTSGVARGIFPWNESVWDGLQLGEHVDSWDEMGTPTDQAWSIIGEWSDWIGWPECKRLGATTHSLVFEDFVMRLGPGASSKRELLDPVRITSACDALCVQRNGVRWAFPTLQQPSHAKGFVTNARLKDHGLWVRGASEHRKDAIRHMALRYAVLIGKEKETK